MDGEGWKEVVIGGDLGLCSEEEWPEVYLTDCEGVGCWNQQQSAVFQRTLQEVDFH